MNFNDRVKSIRVLKSLTQDQFSALLGVKQKTVSNWESGRNEPNITTLHEISNKWAVNLHWLLTGEGEMLKGEGSSALSNEDLLYIPEYNVELSAGFGVYPEDHALSVGNRPFAASWLKKKGLHAKDLKLVRVAGDSMEPLLKDKDIIMLDTSKTKPNQAMPFAVRLDDELLVKSIQHLGDGNLALVSRNKAYNDILINQSSPPEDFQVIGAVVWHAHSWI